MTILLDNTVLSNFALVGRPDLIRLALGDTAATTAETFAEFQAGERLGRLPHGDWSWLTVLELNDAERATFEQLSARLNAGEAACLAMASARQFRVFSDDRDARKMAGQMLVPVSGTLGILVRLIRQKHLTLEQANDLLRRMIAADYRAPLDDLSPLL
jgi:predicted nucleic acid-binding protein